MFINSFMNVPLWVIRDGCGGALRRRAAGHQ
jgi:hypothetical protein